MLRCELRRSSLDVPSCAIGHPNSAPGRGRLSCSCLCVRFERRPYSLTEAMSVVDGSSQIVEAYGAWVRLSAGGAGEKEDGARTLPAAEAN